ncbi:MAG: LuxR family transcriptional regulator [Alphaproteobacteria bacterium]|nr:MAG: LuxR family transcriptional regulator [Alphaproteobacteria bacterium]
MTEPLRRKSRSEHVTSTLFIAFIAVLQTVFGIFFVYDLAASVFGWRDTPISWSWRETLEMMATAGLLLGMILGAVLLYTLLRQRRLTAQRMRLAAGEFYEVVQDRFAEWGLTPSERDVAFFMLKGLSNTEIAALRNTSEGTIKAQTTAIYRKAGVSGRSQLLSSFIEELMQYTPNEPAQR